MKPVLFSLLFVLASPSFMSALHANPLRYLASRCSAAIAKPLSMLSQSRVRKPIPVAEVVLRVNALVEDYLKLPEEEQINEQESFMESLKTELPNLVMADDHSLSQLSLEVPGLLSGLLPRGLVAMDFQYQTEPGEMTAFESLPLELSPRASELWSVLGETREYQVAVTTEQIQAATVIRRFQALGR